jgi:PKHD-type hydroxylase
MLLRIGGILKPHELAAMVEVIETECEFADGRSTAGWHAREVKDNEQAKAGAAAEGVLAKVREALLAHEVFLAAARPKALVGLMISRYAAGMSYGKHVDDALIEGSRADLSFTLHLSPPESYEGGALVVEDHLEDRRIKLPAGELILYPSGSLHRLEPVRQGVRLAVVGWVRSNIRDPGQREILFELELALRELFERDGKSGLFDRLAKTRSNLLRLWAED